MSKNLLRNVWILAVLLLVLNIIIGLLLSLIPFFQTGGAGLAGIISAALVGFIYAKTFKEVISKKTRLHVTIIFAVIQVLLSFLYTIGLGIDFNVFLVALGFIVIYSILIYWTLGLAELSYVMSARRHARLEAEKKAKKPKKSKKKPKKK